MSLPNELIGNIVSFLHINDVKNVIVSHVGDLEIIASIRSNYLRGNLHYLLITHGIESWEKRRSNTTTWMKYNEWKSLFYKRDLLEESHQSSVINTLLTHECCKPFYDLSASAERGILEITEFLLQQGKNVNEEIVCDELNFGTSHRPITAALSIPCVQMLNFLLTIREIEINCPFQRRFGSTLLHFAAVDHSVSIEHFKILLSRLTPLDINCRDNDGKSALHFACAYQQAHYEEKVELLLKAGANVNAFGLDYQSPLQILQQAGKNQRKNTETVEMLLKQYGAFEIRIGP